MTRRSVARYLPFLLGIALVAPGTAAHALIVINQPWLKPAAAGRSTEAFMNITATEGATLIAARTDSAVAVSMQAPGGARTVAKIALPAGKVVGLAPGGYRLTLHGLDKNVRLGDVVPLILTIQDASGGVQTIPVGAVARWHSPVDDERRAHEHRH